LIVSQISAVRIKMKAFTTLILLSVLAAAADAVQVDEPVSTAKATTLFYFRLIKDPAMFTTMHSQQYVLSALSRI
jgi:hypothetical protein